MRSIGNLTIGIAAVVLAVLALTQGTPLPRCAEDVVLVGVGEFEDGRWDAYVCGPARDDLAAG